MVSAFKMCLFTKIISQQKYWLQLSLAHLNQQRQLDFETLNLDLNTLCSLCHIREVSEA